MINCQMVQKMLHLALKENRLNKRKNAIIRAKLQLKMLVMKMK